LAIPLVLLVIKTSPEVMGMQPDGIENIQENGTGNKKAGTSVEAGLTLKEALRTPNFWLISIPGAMYGFALMGIIQNQVAHLTDIGFSVAIAATIVGVVGIANSIGKLGFGYISDRIKAKYAWAIVIIIQIISIILLMNLRITSPIVMVWIYAIIMGIGLGGWLPTMSLLVSSSFGLAAFGTIFGINSMVNMFGSSTGPLFAGYMFDVNGSYNIAFLTFLVLYIVALVATLFLPKLNISD
jgi:MFS family permease